MGLDWEPVVRYLPLLIRGAIFTVLLSTLSLLTGTCLGLVLAFFQISQSHALKAFAQFYVLVARSIPLLLLLFLSYYIPPIVFKIDTSKFFTAWFALFLYSSAYATEIIRSGMLGVPKLQTEAGLSLGLSKIKVMRLIVLPQALRIIIPPYVGLYTVIIKDSSLVSVIGYIELTRSIRLGVMSTYRSFEFYTVALIMYFLICYPLSRYSRKGEGGRKTWSSLKM